MPVTDEDMPQLFRAGDGASLEGQKTFVSGTKWRLILLAVAGATGVGVWRVGDNNIDVLGMVAAFAFVLAALLEGFLLKGRPDRRWYDGRAVAESVKTLAWRYAVKGEPFYDEGMTEREMQLALVEKVSQVHAQYRELELDVSSGGTVTPWMEETRRLSWEVRREVYLTHRVKEQQDWYARKAKYNRVRSKVYRALVLALDGLGFLLSLGAALYESMPTLGAALAAGAGALIAWNGTKQHDFNARAYAAAVVDLGQAYDRVRLADDEAAFALEVSNAEKALSREHTLWLASRLELDVH